MKNIILLLSVTISWVVFQSPVVCAQVFLDVGKVELEASPGETVTGKLTVTNSLNKDIRIRAYWEDFVYKPPYDGSKDFLPAGTLDNSMREHITFSPQTFTLSPQAKRDIQYVVKAPEDFSGGRYGVLFFEEYDQSAQTATGVRIITRVGTLFFMESVDKDLQIHLDQFNIDGSAVTFRMNNLGNTVVIPKGIFYLMDAEGLVADRGEVPEVYLPAAASTALRMELDTNLAVGRYTAVVTFDLGRQYVVVRELDLEKRQTGDLEIMAVRN